MQRSEFFNKSSFFPLFIIFLSVFVFLVFNSCSKNDSSTNPPDGTPGPNEIFIQNMSFASGTRTVALGTTLKWTNKDAVTHTVTSGVPGSLSGIFDSGNIAPQGSFSFTFHQTGVFKYYCRIHTSMTATITVE
ncbi:MAG TPA: plastocyanin/azurin family copper-binding protein [Ignavibacteriaceae bacterium]|nr:plastocyanin/azurin family copper-binding protein [Ignavibacteriaceae bacterium]